MNFVKLLTMRGLDLQESRVFLRVDWNVPLENGDIVSDFKILKSLETLDYILSYGAHVTIGTHLGRPQPKGEYRFESAYSVKPLASWLKRHGYNVTTTGNLNEALTLSSEPGPQITLLENLRFWPGEKNHNELFARALSMLGIIYINDAFGAMHRSDTSIAVVPRYFTPKHRALGHLAVEEIKHLMRLKEHPVKPYVVLIGGAKVVDKLPLLQGFLSAPKDSRPTSMLIGGKLAWTFYAAQGKPIPENVVEDNVVDAARHILAQAKLENVEIVLPIDEVDWKDIGHLTVDLFSTYVKRANTVFANGTMGLYENALYANGTKELMRALAISDAYTVLGGGDAVAAAQKFGFDDRIDYLSTGGGASLAFLATDDITTLHGLKMLIE